ncbi:MAG TPA: FG-GAP-like repeat-containing protein [Flavobacteriales bacterium]|nr:FG-GAP-like repeat-containing protein [Flavobacteriales bacterium]
MNKILLNRAGLALLVFSIPSHVNAQLFGPAQNNPFGLITTGTTTAPAFVDLDGDGDMDMMSGDADGNFYYYENAGTVALASFNPAVTNPFGLTALTSYSNPTFVDLDTDGDFDLMAGESSGDFSYFENTGSGIAPAFGPAQLNPFGLTTLLEGNAAPTFADLDNDGDMDMLTGTAGGNLVYFENTGTASLASMGASSLNPFGLTGIDNDSRPAFADLDGDGDFDILAGVNPGDFYYFENTGTMTAPAYAVTSMNLFSLTNVGNNSDATLADMNNDGLLDLMSGEFTTGFYYFEQTSCVAPAAPTDTTPVANLTICAGNTTTLYATGTGVIGWYDSPTGGTWLGGGTAFTTATLTDTATFYAQDSTCDASATRTAVTVNVVPQPSVFITGNDTICDGQNTVLTANGADTYVWTAGPSTAMYTVSPTGDEMFYVTGTDTNGCSNMDSVLVVVHDLPVISITGTTSICANESTTLTASGANTYIWSSGPSTASYTVSPAVTTPYTVTGIDTNSCTNFATITVTVTPLPDVGVFALGSGATATNFTADSYEWVFCDSWVTAPGIADAQAYLSVFTADYAVIITDNGCSDTSECVTLAAIGINELIAAENVFSVFPNPASSHVTINSNTTFTSVRIIDVNGKLIMNEPANTSTIHVNELQNGLYFIQLMNVDKPLSGAHKLIIDK